MQEGILSTLLKKMDEVAALAVGLDSRVTAIADGFSGPKNEPSDSRVTASDNFDVSGGFYRTLYDTLSLMERHLNNSAKELDRII